MEESVKDSVEPDQQNRTVTSSGGQGWPSDQVHTAASPLVTPHSYQPYSWGFLNRILDLVDTITHGRAGLLQRLMSYLFFGGVAALTNLLVLYLMYYHVLASFHNYPFVQNTLSYIVAAEISILVNFIPNDHFTFRSLPGARRPWIQRCLRFHLTAIVGSVLTYLIEISLSSFLHIETVRAEAIATIIVLIYNFSFHHIFTYRRIEEKAPEATA